MADVELLKAETAVDQLITPTGRQFGIEMNKASAGLFHILFVDGKGGEVPDRLKGLWTSKDLARGHTLNFVRIMWQEADEATARLRRKDYKQKHGENITAASV